MAAFTNLKIVTDFRSYAHGPHLASLYIQDARRCHALTTREFALRELVGQVVGEVMREVVEEVATELVKVHLKCI